MQDHGSDFADIGHICRTGDVRRGQDSSGAGAVEVPGLAADRAGGVTLPAGRRHRDEGARREEAGNGSAVDSGADQPPESRTKGRGEAPGIDSEQAGRHAGEGGRAGRLYVRREEQHPQCTDERGHHGGRDAVFHAGHDDQGASAGREQGNFLDGHGRFHPQAAPPFGGGVQEHAGGGEVRGCHHPRGGRVQPADGRADARRL